MENIKIKDIICAVEKYAPVEIAYEWDNVGLMIGNPATDAKGVLLCLDVTSEVIDEAIKWGCNMILSHHPYIFHSMKNIDLSTSKGRDIEKIIQNQLIIYSAHTNLDFAEYGVNYYLSKIVSEIINKKNITLRKFTEGLKNNLGSSYVKITYGRQADGSYSQDDDVVEKADFMCSCGACGKFTEDILEKRPQIFITGEIGYNDALMLTQSGITVIEAGHYDTEIIILPHLKDHLSKVFKNVNFHLTNTVFKVNMTH